MLKPHQTIPWNALGALRPGMSLAQVREAIGPSIAIQFPGKNTVTLSGRDRKVFALLEVNNARARDAAKVKLVAFGSPCGNRLSIAGLHNGMSIAHATHAQPSLQRVFTTASRELKSEYEHDLFHCALADGFTLEVTFDDDEIILMNIMPGTPAQVADPHFADPCFKLVVLDELCKQGRLRLSELTPENVDATPLDPKMLAAVRSLTIDANNAIYEALDPDYDGDGAHFDVLSLQGVEHLPNLHTLGIFDLADGISLVPLAHHPSLEELDIGLVKDLSVLQTCPKLKRITGDFSDLSDADSKALHALAKAGIAVMEDASS